MPIESLPGHDRNMLMLGDWVQTVSFISHELGAYDCSLLAWSLFNEGILGIANLCPHFLQLKL